MTQLTLNLAGRLRETAERLRTGAPYRWTHQGRCNLGHLVQTVTGLAGADIHRLAIQSEGEWVDHAANYCETSGRPVDALLKDVMRCGVRLDEIADLERLADPRILRWLPASRRFLDYRRRDDVVLYFETWASVLEAEHRWATRPGDALTINGRPYSPQKRTPSLENALDENPASGHAA